MKHLIRFLIFIFIILGLWLMSLCSGCAVSNHGVFPKLVWYWSTDAQLQRQYDKERKANEKAFREVGRQQADELERQKRLEGK